MSDRVSGSMLAITLIVMAAAMMAIVDITIVNVALSDMRATFGAPIDQIGWVSTGYMMANIVVIPMTGWFQRRFGYARYFAGSVALFTLASAACGLAWDLPSLVSFRVLQGLGGGAIIPTAQAILFALYPEQRHGMAAALFGLGAITAPLLGPTLGGYLIEWASWHWTFMINVPIGTLIALASLRFIQQPGFERPRGVAAKIDRAGVALLAVGMASLQYSLEEGNREGWLDSPMIAVLAAIAFIALVTLVIHELETEHPIVDLRVFRRRSYAAGTALNFLSGFALFSGSFMFSLFAGSVLRYGALDIGKVFLASGVISVFMMPLIGTVGSKFDGRWLLAIGVCSIATSQLLTSELTRSAGFWDAVRPNLLRSFGLGFIFVPVSVLALSQLPPGERGNATALFNLTRELGGSVGTAVMGTLLSDGVQRYSSYLGEGITAYDSTVQLEMEQIANTVGHLTFHRELVAEKILAGRVQLQALVLSFGQAFRCVAFVMALGLVLIVMLGKPASRERAPAAH